MLNLSPDSNNHNEEDFMNSIVEQLYLGELYPSLKH